MKKLVLGTLVILLGLLIYSKDGVALRFGETGLLCHPYFYGCYWIDMTPRVVI